MVRPMAITTNSIWGEGEGEGGNREGGRTGNREGVGNGEQGGSGEWGTGGRKRVREKRGGKEEDEKGKKSGK